METLVFLEPLQTLITPGALEAPFRYVIDKRLDITKKGLKKQDAYHAAGNVYDHGELLFSAYDPFLSRGHHLVKKR